MKLQEFSQIKKINQVRRVFESHFGSAMSFDQLTAAQCRNMLSRVKTVLGENRRSAGFHTSEQNPAYLKLVMMEQALTARLKETIPVPPGTTAAPGAAATAQQTAQVLATQKDPKVKAAMEKAAKGQSLNPDEQKIVSGVALTKTESKLRNAYRMLKESEVQQAQVVLAAQDMVDKMQGMLEDVSELQFKELPALVDSIKNQVGIDQATQFNTDATGALTGLMQNLQGAKQQLDQAVVWLLAGSA
jgi:autonomous glycyl radical cofactor GrcA